MNCQSPRRPPPRCRARARPDHGRALSASGSFECFCSCYVCPYFSSCSCSIVFFMCLRVLSGGPFLHVEPLCVGFPPDRFFQLQVPSNKLSPSRLSGPSFGSGRSKRSRPRDPPKASADPDFRDALDPSCLTSPAVGSSSSIPTDAPSQVGIPFCPHCNL